MVISQSNLAGTKQQGRSCRYSWGGEGGLCRKRQHKSDDTASNREALLDTQRLYLPHFDRRSCYFLFKRRFVNAGKPLKGQFFFGWRLETSVSVSERGFLCRIKISYNHVLHVYSPPAKRQRGHFLDKQSFAVFARYKPLARTKKKRKLFTTIKKNNFLPVTDYIHYEF